MMLDPRWSKGSPPRVRGVLGFCVVTAQQEGITPACAGSTKRPPTTILKIWDHPRVCGEYAGDLRREGVVLGSPPRVRGVHRS